MAEITNMFDDVFDKYRENIPLNYLKAYAFRASKMNPDKAAPKDNPSAFGLFSMSPAVFKAYDEKTSVKGVGLVPGAQPVAKTADATDEEKLKIYVVNNKAKFLDPAFATKAFVWMTKREVADLSANAGLPEDWQSPDYVGLVAHGASAGYKAPRGIGAAIKKIKEKLPSKTVELEIVAQTAKEIELPSATYDTDYISFAKGVMAGYITLGPTPGDNFMPSDGKKGGMGVGMIAAIIAIPLAFFALKKK